MRKYLSALLTILTPVLASAQWTSLNSTTAANLHDVDFISPLYGVAAGDGNTILLTTDGGAIWSDINNNQITGDIYSVTVRNTDTIYVSTFNATLQSGTIYKTENGGAAWVAVGTDNQLAHKIDLALPGPSPLYAAGSSLVSSVNPGTGWDTLSNNIAGTNILDILRFADPQVGHISGLVSGFTTYSAYFLRTEDAGANWYRGDVFSFPNNDPLTAMCFEGPDTAFVFTNDYNGFMPSNINGLIKIYGFQQSIPFPGDTAFTFTSQVINSAMPAYINDGIFLDSFLGYAMGNNGTVYKTIDGGVTWTIDYVAGSPLVSVDFSGNTGYAVGGNGAIIKYSLPAAVSEIDLSMDIDVHPYLANEYLVVNTGRLSGIRYEITNVTGSRIESGVLYSDENIIRVSEYAEGVYFLTLYINGKVYAKKFAVSH